MQTVTIEKERLRAVLLANKTTHQLEYAEAMEGYREAFDKRLMAMRKELKKGGLPNPFISDLPKPSEHTNEYEQVLKMLDFSVDDTIELSHDDFANYVLDDWNWKQTFSTTNLSYKKG